MNAIIISIPRVPRCRYICKESDASMPGDLKSRNMRCAESETAEGTGISNVSSCILEIMYLQKLYI